MELDQVKSGQLLQSIGSCCRLGSGHVGSGWVGSVGRVGSVWIGSGQVGSGRVG